MPTFTLKVNGESDHSVKATHPRQVDDEVHEANLLLNQATANITTILNRSSDLNNALRADTDDLKHELSKVKSEKEAAEKELSTARVDLFNAKKKHESHVQKIQSQSSAVKKEFDGLKTLYEEKVNALDAIAVEIKTARQAKEKLTVENKALQKKIVAAPKELDEVKQDRDRFKARLEALQSDHELLQTEHQNAVRTIRITQERREQLEEQVEELERDEEDLKDLRAVRLSLGKEQNLRKSYEKELEKLKPLLSGMKFLADVTEQRDEALQIGKKLCEEKEDLECQVQQLESEMREKSVLLQTAVDVRLRYLALAKKRLFVGKENTSDAALIKAGTLAADLANGTADDVIITNGLVPNPQQWLRVYEKLYAEKPGNSDERPKNLQKTLDCEVSIKSYQIPTEDDHPFHKMRQVALGYVTEIKKALNVNKEIAEKSQLQQLMVKDLEDLTMKIVEMDMD